MASTAPKIIALLAGLLALSASASFGLECGGTTSQDQLGTSPGDAAVAQQEGNCLFQGTFERDMSGGEVQDILSANAYSGDVTSSHPTSSLADSFAEAGVQASGPQAVPDSLLALGLSDPSHDETEANANGQEIGENANSQENGANANTQENEAPAQDTDANLVYNGVNENNEEEAPPANENQNQAMEKGFKSPRAMRAGSSKASAEAHASDHGDEEHGHQSIFQLRFMVLDQPMFWVIWFAMVAFTILVDRLEAYATYHAKDSKTEQMFLARLNAELMMFGCVGLGLFMCTNLIGNIPLEYFAIFEFTDIMCSCGAMGIILVALVLYVHRQAQEREWIGYEKEASEAASRMRSQSSLSDVTASSVTSAAVEHRLMSEEFIKHHGLPPEFSYAEYLKECLARNAVDLIDVQWTTWCLLLIWAFIGFIVRALHADPFAPVVYLYFFLITHYVVFFFHAGLMMSIHSTHTDFIKELKCSQGREKSQCSEHMKGISGPCKDWVARSKYGMQVLSLTNSFLASFYFMHVVFNIRVEQFSWYWNPVLALPLVLNFGFCLPKMTVQLTLVQGIYAPSEDALETALEFLSRYADDLRYLGRIWNMKSRPKLPSIRVAISEEQFVEQMKDTGLLLTATRMHRIFRHFDSDHNGDLGIAECAQLMSDVKQQADLERGLTQDEGDDAFCHPKSPRALTPRSAAKLQAASPTVSPSTRLRQAASVTFKSQSSHDRGANAG